VILVEQEAVLGGRLLWDEADVDDAPGRNWVAATEAQLRAAPETQLLTRTTAVGYFDHNALALVERVTDAMGPGEHGPAPRQRLWQVRAKRVVLATGALERPIVFPGNDRPGVMLAQAVRCYLGRYAVAAGDRAVIFTNNDDAYLTAFALIANGASKPVIVDARATIAPELAQAAKTAGARVVTGGAVTATYGDPVLKAIQMRDHEGRETRVACDLLAVSGGFNPTVHLFSQSGGKLAFDETIAAFAPARSAQAEQSVGGAAGVFSLSDAIAQSHGAGLGAAKLAGFKADARRMKAPRVEAPPAPAIEPCWQVDGPAGKAFVDYQNDVTSADIALSARENYVSVEHLKRYTTLGMAADQGKTSNVNALAIMGELTGRSPAETGTTTYRFPFTPAAVGLLGGRARGELFQPLRRTPMFAWHEARGAKFEEYGGWLRPAAYLKPGETQHAAEQREALVVRTSVGIFDASPLGKIEVKGPDAAEFLDRIYANTVSTLKPGRVRYGLMLDEIGVVIDDGVTARLAEDHFLVGTTSGGALRIAAIMEEWLQCEWTDLEVLIAPVTTAWGVANIAGPKARELIEAVGTDIDVSAEAFPHMSFRTGTVAGERARVFRVSFTGELSYEINVPARRLSRLWEILVGEGTPMGLEPIGVDAWMLLRTEKGYLHVGADTDGTTDPADIGWGHVLKREHDFIGRRSLLRPDHRREDRLQFVGLEALDAKRTLPIGAHVRATHARRSGSQGYVTSSGFSPMLGRGVALGMIRAGRTRHGETVEVVGPDGSVAPARITPPGVYDPKGERLNA
jgi:sarcosine oxidase subunit alpha